MDHDPPIDAWARLTALHEATRLIILINGGVTEEEVERILRRLTADQRVQLRAAMDRGDARPDSSHLDDATP